MPTFNTKDDVNVGSMWIYSTFNNPTELIFVREIYIFHAPNPIITVHFAEVGENGLVFEEMDIEEFLGTFTLAKLMPLFEYNNAMSMINGLILRN